MKLRNGITRSSPPTGARFLFLHFLNLFYFLYFINFLFIMKERRQ